MVPELRRAYNAAFTAERYAAFTRWLERRLSGRLPGQ